MTAMVRKRRKQLLTVGKCKGAKGESRKAKVAKSKVLASVVLA